MRVRQSQNAQMCNTVGDAFKVLVKSAEHHQSIEGGELGKMNPVLISLNLKVNPRLCPGHVLS